MTGFRPGWRARPDSNASIFPAPRFRHPWPCPTSASSPRTSWCTPPGRFRAPPACRSSSDGDTGYGEALNVMRLVAELEQAGAAAVQLEDQQLPKKCGHLNDKRLVPAEEMARKVDAARRARGDLVIVARTVPRVGARRGDPPRLPL